MSAWTSLNIAYDGDWTMPELFLYRITATKNPTEDFDLILYIYEVGDRGETALEKMLEIAHEHGDPECLVSVSGNDTSNHFTFELLNDGKVEQTWRSPSYHESDGFDAHKTHDKTLEQIEDEIGRRPAFGGNY